MKSLAGLMFLLLIAFVIIVDAARLRKEYPSIYKTRISLPPAAWGILSCFFLAFVLPCYLFSRRKYFMDFKNLPVEQKAALGTHSFLKTCLSARIIISWSFFSLALGVITIFEARYLGISREVLTQTMDIPLVSMFFSVCIFFILAGLAAREYPQLGLKGIFDLNYQKVSRFKFFVVPILGSLFLALISVCLVKLRKDHPATPLGTSLAQSSSLARLVFLFFGAFLAPVFEELLFRGLLFRVLLKNKGKVWAILGVSLCFWAVHADRVGDNLALGILLVGSFFVTWVRFWTRTTLTPILMHYTYNIGIHVFSLLLLLITNISLLQYNFLDFFPKARQESILRETIEKNPKFASAYNGLAWLYATENRNLDQALSLVNRALELDPERGEAWDTKAEVLFKMGKADEAIAIEKVLVSRFPNDSFYKEQLQTFQQGKLRGVSA